MTEFPIPPVRRGHHHSYLTGSLFAGLPCYLSSQWSTTNAIMEHPRTAGSHGTDQPRFSLCSSPCAASSDFRGTNSHHSPSASAPRARCNRYHAAPPPPIETVTPPVPVAEPVDRSIGTIPAPLITQESATPGFVEIDALPTTNAAGEVLTPGIPQPTYVVAPAPQISCGCHDSGSWGGMNATHIGGTYGAIQGTGSGVASGLLTPNSNSGGLHNRYPYYNYRHPWFYQGPPSQNVTIVW